MSDSPVDTTLNLFCTSPSENTSISKQKKHNKTLSSPMFISCAAQNRFSKNKLQPGSLIQLARESELLAKFRHAKWEPLLSFPTRNVLPNMVVEFYCNMGVGNGLNGVVYLTFVINGTPILVDHLVLGKALKLNSNAMALSPIDITKTYMFHAEEQRLFLSMFCGVDVPPNVFESTNGINYEHFTPLYQNLAEIIRANFFLLKILERLCLLWNSNSCISLSVKTLILTCPT